MSEEKKLYTVQGNVEKVYEAKTVQSASGNRKWTSQKTDVVMKQFNGTQVRITFWDQAVDQGLERADVSITNLKYTGEYKGIHQFGSTKESKIHVQNGKVPAAEPVTPAPASTPVPPANVLEPVVSEPEAEPEGDLNSKQPHTPQDQPVQEAPKKRGRPAKVEVPVVQTTTDSVPVTPSQANNVLPSHPSEAVVLSNLQAAERIAKALGYDRMSINELITLGDMVGRTLVALKIEAGKDNRMAKYNS